MIGIVVTIYLYLLSSISIMYHPLHFYHNSIQLNTEWFIDWSMSHHLSILTLNPYPMISPYFNVCMHHNPIYACVRAPTTHRKRPVSAVNNGGWTAPQNNSSMGHGGSMMAPPIASNKPSMPSRPSGNSLNNNTFMRGDDRRPSGTSLQSG